MKKLTISSCNCITPILFYVSLAVFMVLVCYYTFMLCFPFGIFHPSISCIPGKFELGQINDDTSVDLQFAIKNIGNSDLDIYSIDAVCGSGNDISITSPPSLSLQPKEEKQLSLKFSPQFLQGNVVKKVVIRTNDPKLPKFVLSCYANVVPVKRDSFPPPVLAPLIRDDLDDK